MKLARFADGNGSRLGVVVDGGIVPLDTIGFDLADMYAVIGGGQPLLDRIAAALPGAMPLPLDSVRLMAPLRPGKLLAIGMNYRRHADEARRLGIAVPDNQVWFNKQTSCVSGPYDDIVRGVTEKLDYEIELGLVIGKPAKSVTKDKAMEHVFGYLIVNDVSARDWQMHSPTFTMGKSFDTHGPIGPWIVTADEIPNPHSLGVRCLVNGEIRQESNTEQLIHPIPDEIAYLSTAFTLESGDILSTGTPEGVGVARQPPVFLVPGDVVRCEIDQIGAIENRVVA